MPRCNKERKSRSVNDIPIQKKQSELLLSLDEDDFSNLLESVSQPSYSRKTPILLPFKEETTEVSSKELSSIGKVCEKNLRDEDEAHQKREEMDNTHRFRNLKGIGELRSSTTSSPSSSTSGSFPTAKKPVGLDSKFEYIDGGAQGGSRNVNYHDVEMQEMTGGSRKYKLGNEESTPHEYFEDRTFRDIESQNNVREAKQRYLNRSVNAAHKWPVCPEENGALVQDETKFTKDELILPPHRSGRFSSFTNSVSGTDEIPNTTPFIPGRVVTKTLPPFPNLGSGTYQHRPIETKSIDLRPVPNKIDSKRRRKKKDEKNNFVSNDITGYMGELPLDQLVSLIEGSDKKKAVHSVSSTVDISDIPEAKEKQRRKSKEASAASVVENTAVPTAAIGNQQGKASETPIEKPEIQKKDRPVDSNKKNSPRRKKGRETESSPAFNRSKKPAEEGEDEFLSADESLAPNQKKNAKLLVSSLVLDGDNYRADTDDLTRLESKTHDEEEFITVANKSKKKSNCISSQQASRTGSTGKMERHSRDSEKTDNVRRNSLEERSFRNYRRPNVSSLADFIDDRKCLDSAKPISAVKHSAKRTESFPDSDAFSPSNEEKNEEEMATCVSPTQARKSSPERSFSYADAAKKSSDSSRETSPLNGQSSVVDNGIVRSDENNTIGNLVSSTNAELPAIDPSPSTGGLSFFYEDNRAIQEPKSSRGAKGDDDSLVLNLGGKTVRIGKGPSASATEPVPEQTLILMEVMQQRWEKYLEGSEPIRFKPKQSP